MRERCTGSAAEAIAAAAALHAATGEPGVRRLVHAWWEHVADALRRPRATARGATSSTRDNQPRSRVWPGKPDVYHAFQATLLPLMREAASFIGAARGGW